MQTNPIPHCPGDELLASFSDGRIDFPQRERLSAHLLLCPDCYLLFLEAAALRSGRLAPGDAGRGPAT